MKTYVLKIGEYYLYEDDVEGDVLVRDVTNAIEFNEKKKKSWDMDVLPDMKGMGIYTEDGTTVTVDSFEWVSTGSL